jgi:hypothetical protein
MFTRLAALVAVCALMGSVALEPGAGALVQARAGSASDRELGLDPAQTDRALLGAEDLPPGWKPLKPEAATGYGFCGSPNSRGRAAAAGPSTNARAAFGADGLHGPFVTDDVYAFRSVDAARSFVSSTKRAVSACPAMADKYQDTGVEDVSTYTVQPSSPIDDVELTYSVAIRTTHGTHAEETARDVAYLRRGSVVSVVTRIGHRHDRAAVQQIERAARQRMVTATRPASPQTSGPAVSGSSGCAEVLDAPEEPALDAGQDGVLVIRASALAPLPAPPDGTLHVTRIGRIESVRSYLRATGVADEITWRDRLTADGFSIAESIGYRGKVGDHGAQALRFASSAQAVDFQLATLAGDCRRGVATNVEPLDGVPSAFTYSMDQQWGSSRRSSTVIGPFVVLLDLYPCNCTGQDGTSLLADWTRAVAAQLGVPHVR